MKDFVLRKWQYDDADSISIVANNPNIAQNLRNTFPSPYTIDDAKWFVKAVTMTDICEKTGLSRGGLYRYYSGTEEIFSEIISKEYVISDRIERKESATKILEDMLEAIWLEIMEKELSLSLAIYEYANIGNEDFFVTVNDKAKRRWISLLQYGMDSGEFKNVDAQQVADLILYYYQGLRMWSRVVPFDKREADNYVNSIRQILLPNIE